MWRAWHRLGADRPTTLRGFAAPLSAMRLVSEPGRLPWTAVAAWARAHGYGVERAAFLDGMIGEMDTEYLAWWRERQAA